MFSSSIFEVDAMLGFGKNEDCRWKSKGSVLVEGCVGINLFLLMTDGLKRYIPNFKKVEDILARLNVSWNATSKTAENSVLQIVMSRVTPS